LSDRIIKGGAGQVEAFAGLCKKVSETRAKPAVFSEKASGESRGGEGLEIISYF
jgi:hypothetical protein